MASIIDSNFPDKKQREVIKKVYERSASSYDSNNVSWQLLDKNKVVLGETGKAVCYAGLPGAITKTMIEKGLRYLKATLEIVSMEEEECIRWLQLCIEHRIIVGTQQFAEDIYHNGLLLDLFSPAATVNNVYTTLCALRFLREGHNVVRNTTDLVDKANVPFWQAFVYAHGHNMSNYGHSFLGFGNSPYSYNGCKTARTNILLAKKLAKHFSGEEVIESNHLLTAAAKSTGRSFNWRVSERFCSCSQDLQVKDTILLITKKATMAIKAKTITQAKKELQ